MLTLRMSSPSNDRDDSGCSSGSRTTKPTRSRRSTGKSRLGCQTCKQKRIKCDETRPVCRQCSKRGSAGAAACKYDIRPAQPKLLATQPPVWNALLRTPEDDNGTLRTKAKGKSRSRAVSEDSTASSISPPPPPSTTSTTSSLNIFDWPRPSPPPAPAPHSSDEWQSISCNPSPTLLPWGSLQLPPNYPLPPPSTRTFSPRQPSTTTTTTSSSSSSSSCCSIAPTLSSPAPTTESLLSHFHTSTSHTLLPTPPSAWHHIASLAPSHPFLTHTILTITLRHLTSPLPPTPLELHHKGLALSLTSAATSTHPTSEALLAAALLLGYHASATIPDSLASDDYLLLCAGVTSVGRSVWPSKDDTIFKDMLSRPTLLVPDPSETSMPTTFATGPSSTAAAAPDDGDDDDDSCNAAIYAIRRTASDRHDTMALDALNHLAPMLTVARAARIGGRYEEKMDLLRLWICWACFCPVEFARRVQEGEGVAVGVMGVYWAAGAWLRGTTWWWGGRCVRGVEMCNKGMREEWRRLVRGVLEEGGVTM